MTEQVQEGNCQTISRPTNQFLLAPQASRHLLLAGGIGLTPMLSMAEALAQAGTDFTLHVAVRSRGRLAFAQRLAQAPWAARVQLHVDDEDPAQRVDLPALLAEPVPGQHLYVCGPAGFMDAALSQAAAAGWPDSQVHVERFGAESATRADDGSFEVEIAGSGQVIRVAAEQSVLQALAGAGIHLPSSCEQGVCGTCLTRVASGIPDHRDQYLLPEEQAANDQFLPCCSRAKTPRLVLELT